MTGARAYYNEIDPYAAQWLRNLIAEGLIPDGHVDERDIRDVRPDDLREFTQCHFFAGIAGWALALQLAEWPEDQEVWTGSCPCQPFSVAGKRKGFDDARHLWPVWRKLIAERRPAVVFGEQVAAASEWLGIVRGDLEAMEYAVGCMPVEAASAGADHLRDRYWFVADNGFGRCAGTREGQAEQPGRAEAERPSVVGDNPRDGRREGRPEHEVRSGRYATAGDGCAIDLAHTAGIGRREGKQISRDADREAPDLAFGTSCVGMADADVAGEGEWREQRSREFGGSGSDTETRALGDGSRLAERESHDEGDAISNGRQARPISGGAGDHIEWVIGADGKARRVKSGIRLLAHGIPARVGKLRAFGNAIDPRPAAAFIAAFIQSQQQSTPATPA